MTSEVEDLKLKKQLELINWPISYGSVKISLKNGRVVLLKIERTVKLD